MRGKCHVRKPKSVRVTRTSAFFERPAATSAARTAIQRQKRSMRMSVTGLMFSRERAPPVSRPEASAMVVLNECGNVSVQVSACAGQRCGEIAIS